MKCIFASSNLDFALEHDLNKIDRYVALVHKQCFVTVWSKYQSKFFFLVFRQLGYC